jgi:hypothetical protein
VINDYAIKILCLQSKTVDVAGYYPGLGIIEIGTSRFTLAPGKASTLDTNSICGIESTPSCAASAVFEIGNIIIKIRDGETVSVDSTQHCKKTPSPAGTANIDGINITIPAGSNVKVSNYRPSSAVVQIGTYQITATCGQTSTTDPNSVCPTCSPERFK